MSIRSVIGSEHTNNEGRYCHSDGCAAGAGVQICKMIKEHGTEETIKQLITDHYGWSLLDTDETKDGFDQSVSEGYYDDRFGFLEGYGIFYTEEDGISPDDWEPITDEDWGYLIHDDGSIEVFAYGNKVGEVNAFSDSAEDEMRRLKPIGDRALGR